MNKETKEKEIKELHEFVLERLCLWKDDKNLLKEIYFCKDDEISDKIKNLILKRRISFYNQSDNTEQYLKKLSKNKVMQEDIRKKIIEVTLGKNEKFEENEKVITFIENGELDNEIRKLFGQGIYFKKYRGLLLMDSFKEFYDKKIKLSPFSITFKEYRSKLRNETEYATLLENVLRERFDIIEKEDLVNNNKCLKTKLKEFRNLTVKSKILARGYRKTSMYCFGAAFAWFSLCWFAPIFFDLLEYICDWQYELPRDYSEEIFIFLSKLLFKLPSFVLCLVGVKFLYLFVQYKTEEREFSMLDSYLEKLPQYCTKERAELVKQLAPHFFPDKKATKISQGFLQDLLLKIVDKDKH